MKQMCTTTSAPHSHEELSRSRLARDVSDVGKVVKALQSQYQNPFDLQNVPSALINIVTGQVASKDVGDSLTAPTDVGKAKVAEFAAKFMVKDSNRKLLGSKTKGESEEFCWHEEVTTWRQTKKLMVSTEVLFRRLLAVSRVRELTLKLSWNMNWLQYPQHCTMMTGQCERQPKQI